MVLLPFVVLLVLSIGHWLFTPVINALTPLLSLSWLGWGLLALTLWLFSGSRPDEPPSRPKP